ncbi:MAG: MmcQ/YjbR family DNA-binding protein [Alphaproteobacteria bacterium]|nr:MmcQ/YjbR family DNA-binding protein [Alphaproteobacteria bacterium]
MPLTRAEARKIALSFDGASEGPYFGKPAVFVAEKFLTRVHTKEEAMVLAIGSMEMRDVMLEAEPKLFYITDHYKNFPYLLARLSKLDRKTLQDLLNARLLQIEAKAKKKRAATPQKKAVAKKPAKKKNP